MKKSADEMNKRHERNESFILKKENFYYARTTGNEKMETFQSV